MGVRTRGQFRRCLFILIGLPPGKSITAQYNLQVEKSAIFVICSAIRNISLRKIRLVFIGKVTLIWHIQPSTLCLYRPIYR